MSVTETEVAQLQEEQRFMLKSPMWGCVCVSLFA